jgi:hypothetical protein
MNALSSPQTASFPQSASPSQSFSPDMVKTCLLTEAQKVENLMSASEKELKV